MNQKLSLIQSAGSVLTGNETDVDRHGDVAVKTNTASAHH